MRSGCFQGSKPAPKSPNESRLTAPAQAGRPNASRARSETTSLGAIGVICGFLALLGCSRTRDNAAADRPAPTQESTTHPGQVQFDEKSTGTTASSAASKSHAGGPSDASSVPRRRPLARHVTDCAVWLKGLVLDLAAPHAFELGAFRLAPHEAPPIVTRGGRNFVQLQARSHDVEFWLPEPLSKTAVTFSVRTTGPERISVALDGVRLGTVNFTKAEEKVVSLGPRASGLERGRHTLRLSRGGRGSSEGLEMSWIRIGEEVDTRPQSEPLGVLQIEQDVPIGGVPEHGWVFRDRMQIRCPVWVDQPSLRVVAKLGVWGEGEAHFDVRLVTRDGQERLLAEASFEKGPEHRTERLDTGPLGVEPQFVEIVLRARKVRAGSRFALSRPELEWLPQTPTETHAERAFVFILSGLGAAYSPPGSAALGLSVLQEFAEEAVGYPDYSAQSPSPGAAIGSLLTGLPPWRHGALDATTPLDPKSPTLATWFEAEGARAALFTGVPHSFSALGFGRGFERVDEVSPVEDRPAIAPLTQFRDWMNERVTNLPRALAFVHLRGGHPPFDLSREQAQLLPPAEYGGDLEPRRAAIQLANVRARSRAADRVLPDEDWTRLEAMRRAALEEQNVALRQTFAELRRMGAWEDSLVIILGDVGSGSRPTIPFDERARIDDAQLGVPLFIKYPKSVGRGTEIKGNFLPIDVYETLARALGLPASARAPGAFSLYPGTFPREQAERRASVAYFEGAYLARLGPYVLHGKDGAAPALCQINWDPGCAQDRAAQDPLATSLLWNRVQAEMQPLFEVAPPRAVKEPLPDFVKNALIVWGSLR